MRVFTAHRRDDRLRLVPEGRSTGALLFGPFWLAFHGAWLAALVIAVAELLLGHAARAHLLEPWSSACLTGAIVAVGIFGHDLRRLELAAAGFRAAGVVAGRSRDEALLRLADRAGP